MTKTPELHKRHEAMERRVHANYKAQGIAAKLSGVRQAHSPPTQKWMDIDICMYGNITALTDVENKYQVKQKTKTFIIIKNTPL